MRAELVDRDVDRRDLGRLRQQDRDAVAAFDAVRRQRIGETVRCLAQPAVAHVLRAAVLRHGDERKLARIALRPAVADLDADVELRRHLPAELAVQFVVAAALRQHAAKNY